MNFCAELWAEIAIKNLGFYFEECFFCQKFEKVPGLTVLHSKVKILRRFQIILRRHASPGMCILETLAFHFEQQEFLLVPPKMHGQFRMVVP